MKKKLILTVGLFVLFIITISIVLLHKGNNKVKILRPKYVDVYCTKAQWAKEGFNLGTITSSCDMNNSVAHIILYALKEVNLWEYEGNLVVTFKKNGKQYTEVMKFYYELPARAIIENTTIIPEDANTIQDLRPILKKINLLYFLGLD